jgi:Fur family ferric uptake transcriptional regulator
VTRAPERPPLDFGSPEDILATLRAAGHRVSAPAARVLDVLFAAADPLSADDIAAAGPSLERTSVYRNLERFEALGVVSHVHVGHGPGLYALAARRETGYAACEHCGAHVALAPGALADVHGAVLRATGFRGDFSHFPIVGICPDCTAHPKEEHHAHT